MSNNQAFELPVSLDDLPNFIIKDQNCISESVLQSSTPIDIATKFVKDLQRFLKEKNQNELQTHYDFTFRRYSENLFKNELWPTAQKIEEMNENYEIPFETQILYAEMCFRHMYDKITQITVQQRYEAWMNYNDLFQLTKNSDQILNLPAAWVWDIIDEFLYQFSVNCQWRAKLKSSDQELIELKKLDNFCNYETVENLLLNLQKIKKQGFFDYFNIVGLMKLYIMDGQHQKALDSIQNIELQFLEIYSKSYACYLNFFYYLGFSFLMTGYYKETINIYEALLLFVNKYKQFCSKSFIFDRMNKLADRTLHLLSISLVLYPKKIDEIVQNLISEQLGQKFECLKQYEMTTFGEVFTKGCPRFFYNYKNLDDLKNNMTDFNQQSFTLLQKDILAKNFKAIRRLNDVNNILRLYTRISFEKASQLLKISIDELKDLLQQQKNRSQSKNSETPFQKGIQQKFQMEADQFEFQFENDMIQVREYTTRTDYYKIYQDNNKKVLDLISALQ